VEDARNDEARPPKKPDLRDHLNADYFRSDWGAALSLCFETAADALKSVKELQQAARELQQSQLIILERLERERSGLDGLVSKIRDAAVHTVDVPAQALAEIKSTLDATTVEAKEAAQLAIQATTEGNDTFDRLMASSEKYIRVFKAAEGRVNAATDSFADAIEAGIKRVHAAQKVAHDEIDAHQTSAIGRLNEAARVQEEHPVQVVQTLRAQLPNARINPDKLPKAQTPAAPAAEKQAGQGEGLLGKAARWVGGA
jgi:hypothetical protein